MRKMMQNEIISLLRKRREGLSFQRIAKELHVLPREKQLLRRTLKKTGKPGCRPQAEKTIFCPCQIKHSTRKINFLSPGIRLC